MVQKHKKTKDVEKLIVLICQKNIRAFIYQYCFFAF